MYECDCYCDCNEKVKEAGEICMKCYLNRQNALAAIKQGKTKFIREGHLERAAKCLSAKEKLSNAVRRK